MTVNKPSLPLAHESRRRSCTPRRIVKTLLALGVLLIFAQTLSWDMPQTLDPQAQASSVQFDNITRAAGIHFPHRSRFSIRSTAIRWNFPEYRFLFTVVPFPETVPNLMCQFKGSLRLWPEPL
jgi:hypothetical protein